MTAHPALRPIETTPRVVTRQQARTIDAAATEQFGIPSIVLMENASRGLAEATKSLLASRGIEGHQQVLVVCGAGNNGGDGYAAARHLHNAGCDVSIIAMADPRPGCDAAVNAAICHRMDLTIGGLEQLGRFAATCDIVIDAIFGTGLDRDVTGEEAHVITALNEFARPIVAADVPSGLDCETGRVLGDAIRATVTVTFAAVKPGLLTIDAQPYVGRLGVAGIGAPVQLVQQHSTPADAAALDALAQPVCRIGLP